MKLIEPSFSILEQAPGIEGMYKHIELAGRTCYKSEDKITEDSAKGFVERMIASGHGAMLEHGTVYLTIPFKYDSVPHTADHAYEYITNKYSKVNAYDNSLYITTNLRVLVENDRMDDLQYLCEPTKYHERRITVKFVCDRGVSHEFVRHRVFSFAQESTRYCNYSKAKFNNEITFIIPCWLNWEEQTIHKGDFEKSGSESIDSSIFINTLLDAETNYKWLITHENWKPQEARAILPNALKTELVMTGFVSDWKHFFDLRDAGSAHPQARELAQPLHQEFIKRNWV